MAGPGLRVALVRSCLSSLLSNLDDVHLLLARLDEVRSKLRA